MAVLGWQVSRSRTSEALLLPVGRCETVPVCADLIEDRDGCVALPSVVLTAPVRKAAQQQNLPIDLLGSRAMHVYSSDP